MGGIGMLGCGTALRVFIVLQPLLAGVGLYWFLRTERLGRVAATAGGLSLSMLMIGYSKVTAYQEWRKVNKKEEPQKEETKKSNFEQSGEPVFPTVNA